MPIFNVHNCMFLFFFLSWTNFEIMHTKNSSIKKYICHSLATKHIALLKIPKVGTAISRLTWFPITWFLITWCLILVRKTSYNLILIHNRITLNRSFLEQNIFYFLIPWFRLTWCLKNHDHDVSRETVAIFSKWCRKKKKFFFSKTLINRDRPTQF